MSKLPKLIRQYVNEELRGVYTVSLVVVEKADTKKQRIKVSLKRDKKIIMDDVPIASTFAKADGYGEIKPIKSGDEGIVLHTKEPMDDLVKSPGHMEMGVPRTKFRPQDAVFFPMFWNDNDTKPAENITDFEEGEWIVAHPSDSVIRIKKDGSMLMYTEASGEQGLHLNAETGGFKLLDTTGAGIEGKGDGTFVWHASDVNMKDDTISLL